MAQSDRHTDDALERQWRQLREKPVTVKLKKDQVFYKDDEHIKQIRLRWTADEILQYQCLMSVQSLKSGKYVAQYSEWEDVPVTNAVF